MKYFIVSTILVLAVLVFVGLPLLLHAIDVIRMFWGL